MPLQSSGIIVVDKSPLIAATGSSSVPPVTNSSCRPNPSHGLVGGGGGSLIGIHSQYNKQHPPFHEWNENETTTLPQSLSTISATTNNNNNLMRRHQRTISSSSSSPQNTKALTLANHNFNQMSQIKQHQQQSHQQHHHTVLQATTSNHPNQVIVSEEFIEHAGFTNATNISGATTTNVINLSANELINQTQIIKLVSDGNGGNVLIDSLGNVTNGNPHHHGNSKLLVGNLTVLSKQSTSVTGQQTINFVNAKNLPYLTTAKNQTQSAAVQKIVNIPLKTSTTNNLIKSSTSSQLHHHHLTNSNIQNNGTPVMQKVAMPRNVQVVTRVQALTPSSPQHQQQQRQQQIQQANVLINQMIMQEKDTHNMVNAPAKISHTGLKRQNINHSMKAAQQQKLNAQCTTTTTAQAVKAFPQPPHHQPQHQFQSIGGTVQTPTVKQVKSQKVVRQFNNSNGNSALTLTMQQQHQPRQTINAAGTYTINSGKLNNIPIQQHGSGAKIISGNNMKNAATAALNSNTKYLMQNHIVLPSGATNSSSTNQNMSNKIGNNVTNNIVVQQQIINTINNSVCGNLNSCTSAGSGTIKFVNAHGAVVQSQAHQHPPPGHQTILQQQHHSQKLRNNSIHHNHHQTAQAIHIPSQQQHHHHQSRNSTQFIDGTKTVSVDNIFLSTFVNNNNNASSGIGMGNSHNPTGAGGDEIMIVNGTQMTDELSARILQSMSQKSIYNNNQKQQHPQQQQQHQQQSTQHKIVAPPPITSPQQHHQTNVILSSPIGREYPMYSPIHSVQVQHHRQAISNPASRTQSIERKQYDSQVSAAKRSSSMELLRVKSNDNQKTDSTQSVTFIDDIPLPCPLIRGDNVPATQQAEHEDDIGEEVRPVPVSTNDARLQALHALLQDHTYVAPMPTCLPIELQSESSTGNINITGGTVSSIPTGIYTSGGIMGQNLGMSPNTSIGCLTPSSTSVVNVGSVMSPCGTTSSAIGYTFGQHVHRQQHDDDANSVISNESRTGNGLDNDLGEETETAPEAEAEDDSITRCICDLTHDDGYMICCDKCSAWQHVDCMGIDRQNIPDEYLCEICQPRQVDRARARNLQLMKRKEQSQLLMNAQLNAGNTASVLMATDANGQLILANQQQDRSLALPISSNNNQTQSIAGKKGKVLVVGKKKDLLKKNKKERTNIKRRESKRVTKRKTKTLSNSDTNQNDRYASNLRQWIENYEVAMTNHYSPELRARLHAISKQQNLLQQITATENKILKSCGSLENKCTTVPHAGGKILISNLDIQPNSPIVELRGKYMLTTQYKNQNPSINMNAVPMNCLQQSLKNQKIPGPFIFFYQLSLDGGIGPEICVDTRTYGNEARFVRRSCRPNAEIQHSFEKGTIHLYLVSLTNIMASTEITIRHEPHDLLALENKNLHFPIAPTSTMCACGLTKDCAFGGTQIGNIKTNRKVVMNGCISETKTASGKKNSQNISRGRSTSSSGESNAGLLSPNTNFTPNLYNSASVSSLMHDSGVYTSSSSPSVSIPSPTHAQPINSPTQQQGQQVPQLQIQESVISVAHAPDQQTLPNNVIPVVKSTQKVAVISRKIPIKQPRHSVSEDSNPSITATTTTINTAAAGATTTTTITTATNTTLSVQSQVEDKRESRKLTREERKMEAIVRAFEKMEKNQQRKQELKQARSSSSGSNTAKRRNSSSPSPKRIKTHSISESGSEGVSIPSTVVQVTQRKNPVSSVSRKKKRKGSKSYQSQNSTQRKRRRSRMNSNDSDFITSEESTSLLSPPIPPNAPSGLPINMPSQSEVTENQMTLMTDLIESQMEKPAEANINQAAAGLLLALSSTEKSTDLLDFPIKKKEPEESIKIEQTEAPEQPQQPIVTNIVDREMLEQQVTPQPICEQVTLQTPQTPPTVSSTCLLVEAAVGPLESLESCLHSNDFKLPVKTKTKKSIMNDWLNQSNDFQQDLQQVIKVEEEGGYSDIQSPSITQPALSPQFQPKSLDTLVQAAATICEYRQTTSSPASFMVTQSHDEPQNLSMVAKKVEEFINQTDANFICTGEAMVIKVESPSEQPLNNLNLPLHSTLNTSGSSSVKKRWLRQAISEETDEIAAASLPAFSPTQASGSIPNGFTTPLKKRRVVRQCNEDDQSNLSPEDLTLPKAVNDCNISKEEQPTFNLAKEEEKSESPDKFKIEGLIKEEITEVEDEVDIITPLSPDEKIVADDNLVKIEPEDISKEIKVDVEKEESCSGELHNNKSEIFLTSIKVEVEPSNMEQAILENKEIKSEELYEQKDVFKNDSELKTAIEPLLALNTPLESDKLVKSELENFESVSDEIADIQKRLHSFHKENIEILQSRNRKSKIARSLKMALSKSGLESMESKTVLTKSEKLYSKADFKKEGSARHRNSKKRHLNFDNIDKDEKEHKIIKSENRKKSQDTAYIKDDERKQIEDASKDVKVKYENSKIKSETKLDIMCKSDYKITKEDVPKMDDKQLQAALTIPNFNNVIPPNSAPNPISSYVLNVSALSNPTYDISSLLLAPPPPPPPTPPPATVQSILPVSHSLTNSIPSTASSIQPPALHLPYYNTIYGKLIDKSVNSSTGNLGSSSTLSSSNLLLSDYLDTKAKSYNTLGGYVSHSALFGLNNSKTVGCLSTGLTGTVTSSSLEPSLSSCTLQTSAKSSAKIVTKTASSDPRLNPILTAPEPPPAPKRKLSINEYRKRKQQTNEGSSGTNQTDCEIKLTSNITSTISPLLTTENGETVAVTSSSETDKPLDQATNVQFSPAPTLLEQQQETLCERLKSLKNKTSSAVMLSLGVSPVSGITPGSLSSPNGISSFSSSASNLSSFVNCLSSSNFTKDNNFETSKRPSLSASSLESISSSPSPASSKESSPDRTATPSLLPSEDKTSKTLDSSHSSSLNSSYTKNCRDSIPSDETCEKLYQNDIKVSR